MSWDYKIEEGALRNLRDLGPSAATQIRHFLETRVKGTEDPRAFGKALRGDLKGFWRYRVRDWRVLCRMEDGLLIVVVVKADHRSTVYD